MSRKISHYLLVSALIAVNILIGIMAVGSDFNRHPDEQLHYFSAGYYFGHWLPPAVDEPDARKVYKQTPWGVSYLNHLDICYFMAAKFAKLVALLGVKSYLGLRIFQVLLFSLIVLVAFGSRDNRFFLILFFTPQVWYMFSYMNGDAFPLFLAVVLGFFIATPESVFSNYLRSGGIKQFFLGGIPVALCLGLLAISKKNYYIFILFILFVWLFDLYNSDREDRGRLLRRLALICLLGMSIFALRFGYDIYINGWNKKEKIIAAMEKYADPKFKPSIAAESSSYRLLRLKQKGVSYRALFSDYKWHRDSFYSFFGTYGYMEFYNKEKYYWYAKHLVFLTLALMGWIFIFRQDTSGRILTLITLGFIVGTIFLSTWHSWQYAFQPQGRYLFPILPIFGIWLRKNSTHTHPFVIEGLAGAFFILSVYSFYRVGMGYLM